MRAGTVVVVVWALAACPLRAQTAAGADLAGITAVSVVVEYVNATALTAGLVADSLQEAATVRLDAAGVRRAEVASANSATLFVAVSLTDIPGGGGVFAYRWDVSAVRVRDLQGQRVMDPVWKCDGIATTVSGSLRRVYDAVGTCAERFAREWRSAND